jgi:hypothetical protein
LPSSCRSAWRASCPRPLGKTTFWFDKEGQWRPRTSKFGEAGRPIEISCHWCRFRRIGCAAALDEYDRDHTLQQFTAVTAVASAWR